MSDRPGDRFRADELLAKAHEVNAGVSWPRPLHERVDDLVELATSVGERTTRKELVAAVVFNTPLDGPQLAKILKRYRLATVRDALRSPGESDNVIEFERHGPGPRRGRVK